MAETKSIVIVKKEGSPNQGDKKRENELQVHVAKLIRENQNLKSERDQILASLKNASSTIDTLGNKLTRVTDERDKLKADYDLLKKKS